MAKRDRIQCLPETREAIAAGLFKSYAIGHIKSFNGDSERLAVGFLWELDSVSPYYGPDFSGVHCDTHTLRGVARRIIESRDIKRVRWVRTLPKTGDIYVMDSRRMAQNEIDTLTRAFTSTGAECQRKTFKPPTIDQCEVKMSLLRDDCSPKDCFDDAETVNEIIRRLDSGDLEAFCVVKVKVSWRGVSATEYLGGCSFDATGHDPYKDEVRGELASQAYERLRKKLEALLS